MNSELGPSFMVEENMFTLGNVLVTTFMFGPGIPVFFPIALLFILLNEGNMRIQLAYLYRKPYNASNQLNVIFLKVCAFMPILYSCFGLWMFSNR